MSVRNAVIAAVVAAAIAPLTAAELKLATAFPLNTTWHKALLETANRIGKDTAGRITVRVFAGGNESEDTIITNMRPGFERYQAAYVSSVGLAQQEQGFNVLAIPFFLESEAEVQAVAKAVKPLLDQKLQARGFHLLGWGTAGWVQLFSKKQVATLEQVKAAKLYTSQGAGSDKWLQWYVSNGFHAVSLPPADITTQLKLPTGAIDAAPSPPLLANGFGINRDAPFMLDLHIAPLTGALIMSNAAWDKLTADDRSKITAAAEAMETSIFASVPKEEAAAVAIMQQRGLKVVTPDAKAAAEFRAAGGQLAATMKGSMVPADVYATALQARDEFRKNKGK